MNRIKIATLPASLLLLGSFLSAQTGAERIQLRERIRENINRLRLLRMTEELGLTEEQTAKIYPAASRIEKEKADIHRKMRQEIIDLRALMEEPSGREAELAEKVKTIRELRSAVEQKDREFEALLEENLTSLQKAKYLLFTMEFYRSLAEKAERARRLSREKKNL